MTTSLEIYNTLKHLKIFGGVYPCDKLPKIKNFPKILVINTDVSSSVGEHWVCLYMKNKNMCEYFDSFGLPIYNKFILNYLKKCKYKYYVYNTIIFQNINSKLCAYFVIAYILCKNKKISPESFLHINIDDFIIKNLT